MSGVADGAMLDAALEKAADKLAVAKQVVVLTGAGVSKESGIPTFRDALTGLWADYEPEKLATPQGFLADPPLVWQWYDFRRKAVVDVQPNPAHMAIFQLESLIPEVVVVTQNVDGLHKRAGSTDIIELHGNIQEFFCFDKRHPADGPVAFELPAPPLCHCGSMMRPAVVWFNEMLPPGTLERAQRLVKRADVVLVIGTSGIVYPAASLPYIAKESGACVIEVNPDETPITEGAAELFLKGPAGKIMPKLIDKTASFIGRREHQI